MKVVILKMLVDDRVAEGLKKVHLPMSMEDTDEGCVSLGTFFTRQARTYGRKILFDSKIEVEDATDNNTTTMVTVVLK